MRTKHENNSSQKDQEKGIPRNPRIKFHFKRQEFDLFSNGLSE